MAKRDVRCQAAVIRDGQILLLRYELRGREAYWCFPGGGREAESDEECVRREVREETGLTVRVEKLLFEVPAMPPDGVYERWRTYLCIPMAGEARPGTEPGEEHLVSIREVRWFDLGSEHGWPADLRGDRFTYPQLVRVRELLGFC